ncbi:MAG: TraM recognition domain-containing protein, partial [Candidatus Eisenbacteria bacterium]
STESRVWLQVGTSVLAGLWDAGIRSFPRLAAATSGAARSIRQALGGTDTDHARAARAFCEGSGQNLDTALAEINGWLGPFRGTELASSMAKMDLDASHLFGRRGIVYIRCPESKLVASRIAYNLLIQWVLDAATEVADRQIEVGAKPRPVSIFFEDLPAWSAIPALPDRLTTLRSRRVAVTAAIQSTASLRHAYGAEAAEAVASSFATKLLLPGIDHEDAERFSRSTGYATRRLAAGDDGDGVLHREPVITAHAIRSPECRHFLFGPPVTFLFPDVAFQCHLAPAYRRPDLWIAMHQSTRAGRRDPAAPGTEAESIEQATNPGFERSSLGDPTPLASEGGPPRNVPCADSNARPDGTQTRARRIVGAQMRSGQVAARGQTGFWVFDRFAQPQSVDQPVANFVVRIKAGERFPSALPGGLECWWRRLP